MKNIKIFLFILLAFLTTNVLSVKASEVVGSVTVVVTTPYTLTVNKLGTGTGTVTSLDGQINCGTTCSTASTTYAPSSHIDLDGSEGANSTPVVWGGDCDSNGLVNMYSNKTCTATFNSTSIQAPNLIASAPLPSPDNATLNVSKTFTSTITNNGTASTGAVSNYFFQIASASNGGGTITNKPSSSMAIIAAGATASPTPSVSHTFTSPGTYSVRACADKTSPAGGGVITESDENDNCSGWTNVTVPDPTQVPTVTTTAISSIARTTATSGGNVTSAGTSAVTARGVEWNIVGSGTISKTTNGTGLGSFVSNITGLTANTNYRVRAYATNSSGTGYGADVLFTTLPSGSFAVACNNATSLKLTWPASSGAVNYTVTRAGYGPPVYSGGALTHTDSPLVNGTSYTYTLTTGGSGGTYGVQTASGTVSGSCISAPNLKASDPTQGSATVNIAQTFTSTISNDGNASTGADFYNIFQVATGFSGATPNTPVLVTLPSPKMPALSAGGSAVASATHTFTSAGNYSVRFCADNNASWAGLINEGTFEGDNCSGWTDVTVIQGGVAPATPMNFNVSAPSCGVWLVLSWDASANTSSYIIYKSTDGGSTYPTAITVNAPNTSYQDTNVLQGNYYYYKVLARNVAGDSALSTAKFDYPRAACPSASDKPTVVTDPSTHATTVKNIISGGEVTSQGSDPVSERGVVWSNDNNPGGDPDVYSSTGNYKIVDGAGGLGKFISNIDVTTGSSYNPWSPQRYAHVRAYARNWYGPSYGNTIHIDLQNIPVNTPTVNCSASSYKIAKNASVNVIWTSTDATSCTLKAGTDTTDLVPPLSPSAGTNITKTLSPTKTVRYTVSCSGPGGTSAPCNVPEIKVGNIDPIYQEQ